MNKKILATAALLGAVGIILGAFAAHGLKSKITAESLRVFETGVRYQMYHALFLLFVGATRVIDFKTKKVLFYLVVTGVLLFSGSIYGLATNSMSAFDFKVIGFVTPIGGLMLVLSWILLLIKFLKNKGDISKN
ncbi:DUF423 domain-containing protein [Hanstruepera marina]|uniref:DUF423 domain-containing protein n=1 Tax=Hanstruepera marina TaxID=2873265 RepID=UPI001CA6CEB7|nr:DUF423 domain-containing protein [Hanstruepera marina]